MLETFNLKPMYPYLKELTLDEALQLPNSDKNVKAYFPDYDGIIQNPSPVKDWIIENIYSNGKSLSITALDYATHILKQKTPPEGWGYGAYELSSGRYDELPYKPIYNKYNNEIWGVPNWGAFGEREMPNKKWNEFAFRLTDLARVEGTDTDKTEINAAQVEWLLYNNPETNFFYYDEDGAEFHWRKFEPSDIGLATNLYKYKILTSTYNALPQEFRDLAAPIPPSGIQPPVTNKFEEIAANIPKPSFASHFNLDSTDWEAKCKELEDQYNESNNKRIVAETQLMHARKEIEGAKAQSEIADKYINAFQKKLDLLYQLQETDKELHKLSSDYYPF